MFRLTGHHFQGPSGSFYRVVPENLLLPSFPPQPHNFSWFHVLLLRRVRRKHAYCSYCVEYNIAWSSLKQGKKSQHFLLDRVAKFTTLCLEQGQGFAESTEPPYPNSCWVPPPPPPLPHPIIPILPVNAFKFFIYWQTPAISYWNPGLKENIELHMHEISQKIIDDARVMMDIVWWMYSRWDKSKHWIAVSDGYGEISWTVEPSQYMSHVNARYSSLLAKTNAFLPGWSGESDQALSVSFWSYDVHVNY